MKTLVRSQHVAELAPRGGLSFFFGHPFSSKTIYLERQVSFNLLREIGLFPFASTKHISPPIPARPGRVQWLPPGDAIGPSHVPVACGRSWSACKTALCDCYCLYPIRRRSTVAFRGAATRDKASRDPPAVRSRIAVESSGRSLARAEPRIT